MSRPLKKEVDYFPHSSNLFLNPKIVQFRKKHGLAGYGFYIALLELLCRSENFELPFGNNSRNISIEVLMNLTNCQRKVVERFVNDLIEFGILSVTSCEQFGKLFDTSIKEVGKQVAHTREVERCKKNKLAKNAEEFSPVKNTPIKEEESRIEKSKEEYNKINPPPTPSPIVEVVGEEKEQPKISTNEFVLFCRSYGLNEEFARKWRAKFKEKPLKWKIWITKQDPKIYALQGLLESQLSKMSADDLDIQYNAYELDDDTLEELTDKLIRKPETLQAYERFMKSLPPSDNRRRNYDLCNQNIKMISTTTIEYYIKQNLKTNKGLFTPEVPAEVSL